MSYLALGGGLLTVLAVLYYRWQLGKVGERLRFVELGKDRAEDGMKDALRERDHLSERLGEQERHARDVVSRLESAIASLRSQVENAQNRFLENPTIKEARARLAELGTVVSLVPNSVPKAKPGGGDKA